MKLVKQKILHFKEGNSDKIYEVDLCEVEGELFVVNFRYGRRGATLREGTKTVFPVGREEAEGTFDKLVASKEKKGYREEGSAPAIPTKAAAEPAGINVARQDMILKYLHDASTGNYHRNWKVSRIIWRAGDLDIKEAIPLVARFLTSKDEFEQYAAVRTLAKFDDETNLDVIFQLARELGFNVKVGRIAMAYLLKIAPKDGNQLQEIYRKAHLELPAILRQQLEQKKVDHSELAFYFLGADHPAPMSLFFLYLLSYQNNSLRPALQKIINRVPLKVNRFKSLRYIYRAAEIIGDAEFFTLIAKRIALSGPGFQGSYLYVDDQWKNAKEELKKKNSSIAFSSKTKDHFNRAAYKYIYELGQSNPPQFIQFATALLCNLDESIDKVGVDILNTYTYNPENRRYHQVQQVFPKYANFPSLMYIVYGNTDRLKASKTRWHYIGNLITPSDLSREEIYPELWNQHPEAVLSILANSKAEVAFYFALRIIKDNPTFLEKASPELLEKLLEHPNALVIDLVLGVLEKKYASEAPGEKILLLILAAKSEKATDLGLQWLAQHEANYFKTADFIGAIIVIEKNEILAYLSNLFTPSLKYNVPLGMEQLEVFVQPGQPYSFEHIVAINELIAKTHFGELFHNINPDRIEKLAADSTVTHKLFGATLAQVNTRPTYELIKDHIGSYLDADEEMLRKAGVEMLADFPENFLKERHQLIGTYCFSPYPEVRTAIQPVVGRLIQLDEDFKKGLLDKLLNIITEAETHPGVHDNSYELLKQYYGEKLESLDKEDILHLLLSQYTVAQKLGYDLFQERIKIAELGMEELVSLSKSDVRALREELQEYFQSNTDRINYEFFEALSIFNSPWDDMRNWALVYFEENIEPRHWTLDTLLYVCDHIHPDVQSFGRKMVTRHFKKEEGLQLMLKLQEHPSKPMQFFTTNYLETYAKDQPVVILQLELFFKTTLFNINQNRTSKTRVFQFLEKESVKDEKVAAMTVRILDAILNTKTLKDKSSCIDILIDIKEAFPAMEVPLTIKAI